MTTNFCWVRIVSGGRFACCLHLPAQVLWTYIIFSAFPAITPCDRKSSSITYTFHPPIPQPPLQPGHLAVAFIHLLSRQQASHLEDDTPVAAALPTTQLLGQTGHGRREVQGATGTKGPTDDGTRRVVFQGSHLRN